MTVSDGPAKAEASVAAMTATDPNADGGLKQPAAGARRASGSGDAAPTTTTTPVASERPVKSLAELAELACSVDARPAPGPADLPDWASAPIFCHMEQKGGTYFTKAFTPDVCSSFTALKKAFCNAIRLECDPNMEVGDESLVQFYDQAGAAIPNTANLGTWLMPADIDGHQGSSSSGGAYANTAVWATENGSSLSSSSLRRAPVGPEEGGKAQKWRWTMASSDAYACRDFFLGVAEKFKKSEGKGELNYYYAHSGGAARSDASDAKYQPVSLNASPSSSSSAATAPAASGSGSGSDGAAGPTTSYSTGNAAMPVMPEDVSKKFNRKQSPFGTDVSKYDTITKYSWYDDNNQWVRCHVSLPAVGKHYEKSAGEKERNVRLQFGERSFELLIDEYEMISGSERRMVKKNFRLGTHLLHEKIRPEACKFKVKPDRIQISFRKKTDGDIWFDLIRQRCVGDKDHHEL